MGGIYWLASYPKSGNTWFRSVLANYMSKTTNPLSINDLNTGSIASSRVWVDNVLGFDTADMTHEEVEVLRPVVYNWSIQETPKQIGYHKIHDAYCHRLVNRPIVDHFGTLGAVYILRNPLDVAPSLANHNNTDIDTAIAQMSDPDYALSQLRNKLPTQLLQRLGTWSQHVESWVDAKEIPIHVIRYEDMQSDPMKNFNGAFDFMGIELNRDKLERAIEFSRFENLAAQEESIGFVERPPKTKRFFRTGRVGDWRNTLSKKQAELVIANHKRVMYRFGYLDEESQPIF